MNRDLLNSIGLLLLRLVTGAGMAYHGYGKLFTGRMEGFVESVGQLGFPIPLFFAWAAALSEFLGGILVAIGLKTRWASFFIFATMAVAFFVRHRLDPFRVKELALLYLAMAGVLVFTGGGKISADRA